VCHGGFAKQVCAYSDTNKGNAPSAPIMKNNGKAASEERNQKPKKKTKK
jgi:hypothetical protein